MSLTAEKLLAIQDFPEVDALCALMQEFVFDPDAYRNRFDQRWDETGGNKHRLWEQGMFDHMALCQMLLRSVLGGVNDRIVRILVQNAVEHSLLNYTVGNWVSHWFNRDRIIDFAQRGILRNALINRFEYIVYRHSSAVVALEVEKNGDIFIGTAFVCRFENRSYLVTAKHNIDIASGIKLLRILDVNNSELAHDGINWTMHDRVDLAACQLANASEQFSLSPLFLVLTQVLTMGFPSIPTTDKPYLLAHTGEVNAKVSSYLRNGSYILISNATSPGSSGSPVLDITGLVLGVVTDAFETGYEPGKFPTIARAAIDVSELAAFLKSIPPSHT